MAAPSYTEDLTDIDLAANDTNWEECGGTYNTGGASAYDTDYPYIQGGGAVTQQATKANLGGLMVDASSGITLPTDGAYFVWQFFASSTGIDTNANGGLRVVVGSSRSAFYAWYVGGSDFGRYPYGGWVNHAVNTGETSDDTEGSPTSTEQYIGAAYKSLVAVGKGNPHGVDAIRYGRGSSIFEFGDLSNGYCTIAGFATEDGYNDATNGYHRWGLIVDTGGTYLYKGKMTLGTVTNAVDFRDSDRLILIDDTPKATTNFNTIEVNNASSRVDMDNFVFKALGTQSPGRWVTNANADLNLTACQFFDMGAFTFGGTGSEFLNCKFQACGLITVDGGKLNGSQVLVSTVAADASAIDWDVNTDPDGYLDDLTVSEGTNAHHAIEFGSTCPASMTIRGLDVGSDFASTDSQNNSTFYISDTNTGNSYTINCVGCSGNMTYKSAGASVTIVSDPVTVKATCVSTTGTALQNVRVFVKAKDGTGPFPFEDTVTIANSGTTATVTHTSHGMATNDYVFIDGASHYQNNGVFQITVSDASTYTYTMASAPGSSPTGTIEGTFVALYGLSDVNGEVSTSRVYSSDQPITGWARNTATGSPYYQQGVITGSVDSTDGLTATAVLVADE